MDQEPDSPYVFRDEDERRHEPVERPSAEGVDVVIVDGRAMTYRWSRRE
jgi:hypothetical protein